LCCQTTFIREMYKKRFRVKDAEWLIEGVGLRVKNEELHIQFVHIKCATNIFTHLDGGTIDCVEREPSSAIKGVAKKMWCFKFDNFGLRFVKENDRYSILLLRIWKL
jgi:hypothetical protein